LRSFYRLSAVAMYRRLEDKIRRLCGELASATEHSQQIAKLGQLRRELQLHMQRLRARLATYPIAEERRVLNGIPPPDVPPQNAVEPTIPVSTVAIADAKTSTTQTKPDSKDSPDRQRAS
jgi:hypothetical protein